MALRIVCLSVIALVLRVQAEEGASIPIGKLERETRVSFNREILPLLRKHCMACHHAGEPSGELNLESVATIRAGGESGPAVVPTKGMESHLVQLASHREEPIMPPPDNEAGAAPLSSEELALLVRWIDEGAEAGPSEQVVVPEWRPVPASYRPIFSVDVSPDGQYAVCSRANQIDVYHLTSGQHIGRQIDPTVATGAAGNDVVRALCFHPNGSHFVSGGYGAIRLWQRQPPRRAGEYFCGSRITAIATSLPGEQIAVGTETGAVQVLHLSAVAASWTGHTEPVTALDWSADGEWLVSAGADASLKFWRSESEDCFATLRLDRPAHALAWVPGTNQVAVAVGDTLIRVWQRPAEAGEDATQPPVAELAGHTRPVTSLASVASLPGQLVSGSEDGTVRLWSVGDRTESRQWVHGTGVNGVAIRPEGDRVATTGTDGTIRLWDVEADAPVRVVRGNPRQELAERDLDRKLQVAERRLQRAVKRRDESIERQAALKKEVQEVVDARIEAETKVAEKRVELARLEVESAQLKALLETATPQHEQLKQLSESTAQTFEQFRQAAAALKQALTGAQDEEESASPEDAPTKLQSAISAAVTASEQQLQQWNQRKEELGKQVEQSRAALLEAEKGRDKQADHLEQKRRQEQEHGERMPTLAQEQLARELDRERLESARDSVATLLAAGSGLVSDLSFSGDGNWLAWSHASGAVFRVHAVTGLGTDRLDVRMSRGTAIQYSAEDQLVTLDGERLHTWHTQPEWAVVQTITETDEGRVLTGPVQALAFDSGGDWLAAGSGQTARSGELSIWRMVNGKLTFVRSVQDAHSDTISNLEFAPHGGYIATAGADRMAKVFRRSDGTLVATLEGHTHHVLDVAWQADGFRLATAGADKIIKLWNTDSWQQERSVGGFGEEVTSIRFLGIDATTLATSGDRVIRVHNADNGELIRQLQGSRDFVYAASSTPDGATIIAGGLDGELRVWLGAAEQPTRSFPLPEEVRTSDLSVTSSDVPVGEARQ